MPEIEWKDGNLPVSLKFDDPYYSRADGRAETSHVFINGNDLPLRWADMKTCVIAELGFGTGLNFLETVFQWRKHKPENATLTFISFEQYPMQTEEMQRALSIWPELSGLAETLCRLWELDKNLMDTEFLSDVRLQIYFGDANQALPPARFKADAWYLDGFSPAKNPELWNEMLMRQVAKHTVANGTFATYTAAGFVRRGLQSAGFEVHKINGFGTKRDMLIGKMIDDIDVANGH